VADGEDAEPASLDDNGAGGAEEETSLDEVDGVGVVDGVVTADANHLNIGRV
jgi:hypothetical protein